jgi:PAS domain S-box-containing protein
VEALIVETDHGPQVFSLVSAAAASNRLRGEVLAQVSDAVIAVDADQRVTYLNAAAEWQYRVSAGDVLGSPLSQIYSRQWPSAEAEAAMWAALREQGEWRGEMIHRTHDGRELQVESCWSLLRDADGADAGMVAAVRDITERKRAEEALRESEQRLHQALMNVSVPTVLHADDDTILLVNQVWTDITGYRIEDIPTIGDWTHKAYGERHAAAKKYIDTLFDTDTRQDNGEFTVTSATGEKRVWHFSSTPVGREPSGRRLIVSTAIDVTERKRVEEQLQQLAADLSETDRRKDEFLATLAHELRNPLAPIRNGLQLIKLAEANGTVEQARTMMERQLTQMVRLVDDLLDVSRISRGKIELRTERIDLRAVVESAVETSGPLIDQAGHELVVTLPDEPVFVDGDATRLAQVVSNLLTNSAKYTHRGGHIRLTVRRDDEAVAVTVTDDGIGIPPAMLDKVFVMFTQVDRTLEKTTGGLGIGLSLVKGLVEMHGGTIEARSEGERQGSEFVVRLPLAAPAEGGADATSGPADEVVSSGLRRILVVDDNVDAADSMGQLLELLGNEVRTANDGEAGIAVAEAFRPEVVFMDIGMPKLNGHEACRRIRAQPWGKGMVLVALTGWGQDEDRRKTAAAGFDHHLVKPVDPHALNRFLGELRAGTG